MLENELIGPHFAEEHLVDNVFKLSFGKVVENEMVLQAGQNELDIICGFFLVNDTNVLENTFITLSFW